MAMLNSFLYVYQRVQAGAPKIAKLPYKWLNYGDNELVNDCYFMVYKPTYNWGAPSCNITI